MLPMLLWGCTKPVETGDRPPPPDTDVPPPDTDVPPDTDTDETTTTGTTGDTGGATGATGDTGAEEVIDCAALSPTPVSFQLLATPRAYHGLAFDAVGNLIGSDAGNLIA